MHKTFWLTGKDGFDKELPDPVSSDNNHGFVSILNILILPFHKLFKGFKMKREILNE
jgi:hypothetical protein